MSIAEITLMRGAGVDFIFVQGILNLVRKNTGREAGDNFLDLVLVRGMKDIVVDQDIVAQEGQLNNRNLQQSQKPSINQRYLVFHVLEETTDYHDHQIPCDRRSVIRRTYQVQQGE
jgi:hypothetical protein